MNASEYGSAEVLLNGEIGRYLGIRVVVTNNVPASGDGGATTSDDWGTGTNLNGHQCLMLKGQKASAFAWGRQPDIQVFPFPSNLQTRIVMSMDYQAKAFYTDAVVKLYVLDV